MLILKIKNTRKTRVNEYGYGYGYEYPYPYPFTRF